MDSLKNELSKATNDSVRYNLAYDIVMSAINTNYEEALKYAKIEYEIASKYPKKYDLAECYQHLAYACSYLGKNDSAIYYAKKGLDIPKSYADKISSSLCNILAGVYFDIGDYQKSNELYLQSVEISDSLGDTNYLIKTYSQMASMYIEMGYFSKAEDYLNRSVEYFKRIDDKKSLLALYNNIGNLYSYQKKYKKALTYFNQCLDISRQIGHIMGEAYSLSNIGETYQRLDDFESALKFLLLGKKIFTENKLFFGQAGIKSSIGATYLKMGELDKAHQYLIEALKYAEEQKLKRYTKAIYQELSTLFEKWGNHKKSLEYYKLFAEIKDSIYNEEKSKQIADMRIKYESEKIEEELQTVKDQRELQDLRIQQQENEIKNQRYYTVAILIAAFVLIIIALLIFINYRLKQKTKYTELTKKHLELSLRFLRSQMNPHFIFNALSSIQGLILERKISSANTYLGKFAILMRGLLENSSSKYILLSEELKNLELYLELEQMRYDNKFDFDIKIDKKLDIDEVSVPPMLLQPFLENSIKHGIANLNNQGRISINIDKKEDVINCTIIDNGVGRNATNKRTEEKEHKSMGIQLVRERLLNYKKENHIAYSIDFEDLTEKDVRTSGTKVIIKIPFEATY